jgi:hypothetical protein
MLLSVIYWLHVDYVTCFGSCPQTCARPSALYITQLHVHVCNGHHQIQTTPVFVWGFNHSHICIPHMPSIGLAVYKSVYDLVHIQFLNLIYQVLQLYSWKTKNLEHLRSIYCHGNKINLIVYIIMYNKSSLKHSLSIYIHNSWMTYTRPDSISHCQTGFCSLRIVSLLSIYHECTMSCL